MPFITTMISTMTSSDKRIESKVIDEILTLFTSDIISLRTAYFLSVTDIFHSK